MQAKPLRAACAAASSVTRVVVWEPAYRVVAMSRKVKPSLVNRLLVYLKRFIGCAWQQRGKFLTADPADDVGDAQRVDQHIGEQFQDFVASGMAEPVVHRLEMVDIEDQHTDRTAHPGLALDHARAKLGKS